MEVSRYLSIRGIGFVSHEQKITLIVHVDLFLESASFRRFFLHVSAGEEAMDQGRLATGQCAEKTDANV